MRDSRHHGRNEVLPGSPPAPAVCPVRFFRENNPLQSLPEEPCNLKNTTIYIFGAPDDMAIPEKLKQIGVLNYEEHHSPF